MQNEERENQTVFRVFDEGKWHFATLQEIIDCLGDPNPKEDVWAFINGRNITRSTGLKDRNNKVIFEGDILSVEGDLDYLLKVVWHHVTASFQGSPATQSVGGLNVISGDNLLKYNFSKPKFWYLETEIVGNIFGNPELLKLYED